MELRTLTDADREASWELDAYAFRVPPAGREAYLRGFVPERVVGLFDGERLVAQTCAKPFGQFFGGRPVPMGGLAGVAVAPDARGRGCARRVIEAALRAMRERGEVISSLFPATTSLYRGLGWEVAGATSIRSVAPRSLRALPADGAPRPRPAVADDGPALRRCYARMAREVNGFVDRPASWWGRLEELWRERRVYVVPGAPGELDGYLVYRTLEGPATALGGPFQLRADELVARTRPAALALWRLLGSWSAQADRVVHRGTAEDPLLLLLPEQELTVLGELRWMTRVVDAAGAVEARGFAPGVDVEVELALSDAQLSENDGAWVLRVCKGRGRLEPGGSGALKLGIGGFSALYTGWAGSAALARADLLHGGSAEERGLLDAAFAGPTPWMLDEF